MRPDQDAIEAAFKVAHEKGYGIPYIVMRAAIDAYLAKMPKAWAIKIHDYPIDLDMIYSEKEVAVEDAENMTGACIVRIALVEIPEEKE